MKCALALLPVTCFSQWRFDGLDFSANGNLFFGRFTSSDQVFLNRQNAGTVSTQVQLQGMAQWQNERHTLGAGLGYRLDSWAMNRTNLGDALLAILVIPFGGSGNINAGWPDKISVNVHQLSLPFSYAYRLTANEKSVAQFSARLMVMPAVAVGNRVNIVAETEPTPGLTASLKSEYGSSAGNFSLMIAPEINLHLVPSPKGIQFYFGLQPFAYDAVQPLDTWMKGGFVLRTTFGIRLPLVKK